MTIFIFGSTIALKCEACKIVLWARGTNWLPSH